MPMKQAAGSATRTCTPAERSFTDSCWATVCAVRSFAPATSMTSLEGSISARGWRRCRDAGVVAAAEEEARVVAERAGATRDLDDRRCDCEAAQAVEPEATHAIFLLL